MAITWKLRRGTTSQHSTFTGAAGEVTVDTTKNTVVVHDGSTAGGVPLAKESAVLIKTNNLSDVSSVSTARTNLGVTATGSDTTYAYRANNLSDLASASAARTNLGLGTAALVADSTLVHTSGNETIAGTKTFSSDASISGLTVGKGGGSVATNTAVGSFALSGVNTGAANNAFGYGALVTNTLGANNNAIGYLTLAGNTSGNANSAFGHAALNANTTGSNNVSVGFQSLVSNTTASNNTAVGYQALYANTISSYGTAIGFQSLKDSTGVYNTAVGGLAMLRNTTGTENTAVGTEALANNTTGYNNVAIGRQALIFNTTASNNTAVGYQAAYANTTGAYNTAVGNYALTANTTGQINTAVGYAALNSNTTGTYNTAFGVNALQYNTAANYNTAIGYQAGFTNVTASKNSFIGSLAGYTFSTTGETGNTFVGFGAGYGTTTGIANTFVGAWNPSTTTGCGQFVTTGSYNTILGAFNGNQGGLNISTASNWVVLSDGAGNIRGSFDASGHFLVGRTGTLNNGIVDVLALSGQQGFVSQVQTNANSNFQGFNAAGSSTFYVVGTGGIYSTSTTITAISDISQKENIVQIPYGLSEVQKLKPVKFDFKTGCASEEKDLLGFIAQEVQSIIPEIVKPFGDDGLLGLKMGDMLPVLVKAIQELNAKVEAQALEIATLKGAK